MWLVRSFFPSQTPGGPRRSPPHVSLLSHYIILRKTYASLTSSILFFVYREQNRSTVWSMWIVGVDHMVWGAVLRARTLFLLPTSTSTSLGQSGRYRRLPPCNTRQNFVNCLGTWNVRGIILWRGRRWWTSSKRGSLICLPWWRWNWKGEGKVSWVKVNGIISGVQEVERARERVAFLLMCGTVQWLNMGV